MAKSEFDVLAIGNAISIAVEALIDRAILVFVSTRNADVREIGEASIAALARGVFAHLLRLFLKLHDLLFQAHY